MSEEQTVQPDETAPVAVEPPQVVVKTHVEKVTDLSAFDTSISMWEEELAEAPVERVEVINSRIETLKAQRQAAQKSVEYEEFEAFKREKFNQLLSEILPAGVDPNSIPGASAEERLANANKFKDLYSSAITPLEKELKELKGQMESAEPTEAQRAAWGKPIKPGTDATVADVLEGAEEDIDKGNVQGIAQRMKGIFARQIGAED
jgi:hypothetical protein